MTTELEVTFYEGDDLSVSINLTTDDPVIRKRFATMAKEMEDNAHALLSILTEEPNGFDGDREAFDG